MFAAPRHRRLLAFSLLLWWGCGSATDPVSPTAPSPMTPATGGSSSQFAIFMPIEAADTANTSYGLWPFGVHGGGHSDDGHPGWDVEYRAGASARAAASGSVQSLVPDSNAPGRMTLQLQHTAGGQNYRTVYTNLASVAAEIAVGARVSAGQALGTPGTYTAMIGTRTVTYSMIHFQVDDFTKNAGLTNVHAVSPESHLDPSARAVFDTIWRAAAYTQEPTEPFASGSRDTAFPLTRVWTRDTGTLAARIEFRRMSGSSPDHEYSLLGDSGVAFESGAARLDATARPLTTVDLMPQGGAATRLGVYDIVNDTMRLDLGPPGGARPASLATASVYRTR